MGKLGDIWELLDKKAVKRVVIGIFVFIFAVVAALFVSSELSLENQISQIEYVGLDLGLDFNKKSFDPKDFVSFVKELNNETVNGTGLEYNDFKFILSSEQSLGIGMTVGTQGFYPVDEVTFDKESVVVVEDKGHNYQLSLVKKDDLYWICGMTTRSRFVDTARGVRVGDSRDEMLQKMGDIPNSIDNINGSEVFSYEFRKFCMSFAVKYGQVQEIQMKLNCY